MTEARATPDSHSLMPDELMDILRHHYTFKNLTETEFRELTTLLRSRVVPRAMILVQQGEQKDTDLYIVRKGRLAIRAVEKNGRDPVIAIAKPGDMLNEMAFLTGRPAERTVETVDEVQLWHIKRDDFTALLADHESLAEHLQYPDEVKALRDKSKQFEGQRPGELVLWRSYKHGWVLFRSLWLTLLLLIAMLAIILPPISAFAGAFAGPLLAVLGFIAFANFLWNLVDYLNDYYIVTDQRVIHRERVVLIYDAQDETPMGKVQNVTVDRPGFLYTLFDMGNVRIETQGTRANIQFEFAPKPEVPNKLILERRDRARIESRASERSRVRVELVQEMGMTSDEEEDKRKKAGAIDKPKSKAPGFFRSLGISLQNFQRNALPRLRLDRGNEIVYRKHWLSLLGTALLPFALALGYTLALLFIRVQVPDLSDVLFRIPFVIAVILIGVGLWGWFIWQYENWRNDLYILTPDRLIDYKRTPFGLGGETKRTASLENVQNVTATTRGFIDTLFNVGDVSIRTGGVENELSFARVYAPRRVQGEIVKQLEEFQNNKRIREAKQRRQEFIEWIGIYDELTRLHTRDRLV
jgi:uncharacterized membrane protein YdbT with pleckstrin-like domain